MIIKLYPENPNPDHIRKVTWVLEQGGIVIYPTDTIYAMGCDIKATKTIENNSPHRTQRLVDIPRR